VHRDLETTPVERYALTPTCTLVLERGDLTKTSADAIVNAANEAMLGGGGVDGAIHRAAGPALVEACRRIPEVRSGSRCPTGEARITPGFDLPACHVIHTVGPIYHSAGVSGPQLESAYRSSLGLANEHGLWSVAVPAISCGVFGYPLREAALVALETCRAHAETIEEIRFVLFSKLAFEAWGSAVDAIKLSRR
jgi:O-acetyl-ADP-ribose deacetylase (regulator of RNase III)